MRASVVALCASLGLCWGCQDDGWEPSCNPPAKPEYSCAAVAPGTADTCVGPTWKGTTYDADKAFPVGCTVRLPLCADFYPGEVQTCMCQGEGSNTGWGCPI